MIEIVVLLGLLCHSPDLPADQTVASVLQTEWPAEAIYGSSPYRFPTTSRAGDLTYKITVDPLYDDYAQCFAAEVRSILNDDRSWGGVREAEIGETPNAWIILAPPGAACGLPDWIGRSCAAGANGRGEIRINSLHWFRGPGWYMDKPDIGLADDRRHLVNHEVGHMLGHRHSQCLEDEATVMTQSKEFGVCEFRPWPIDLGEG